MNVGNKILNSVTENNVVAKMIKDATNKDGGNLWFVISVECKIWMEQNFA